MGIASQDGWALGERRCFSVFAVNCVVVPLPRRLNDHFCEKYLLGTVADPASHVLPQPFRRSVLQDA